MVGYLLTAVTGLSDGAGVFWGSEEVEGCEDEDEEGAGEDELREELEVDAEVVGEEGGTGVRVVLPIRVIFSFISMSLVASWKSSLSKNWGLYAFVPYCCKVHRWVSVCETQGHNYTYIEFCSSDQR